MRSDSSLTTTMQLFECRSIPLYFMIGLLWVIAFRKLTLTHTTCGWWGGRLDDYQDTQRRKARRLAHSATYQVRAGSQPQNRQSAQHHDSRVNHATCG